MRHPEWVGAIQLLVLTSGHVSSLAPHEAEDPGFSKVFWLV